ncbi:MAG: hypothetical protein U5N26_05425 [Candidatus Marinimicrobia bacterium]|nr:hypothetical protein [Candidatus Neomarinimicrobiota bacterium]
MNGHFIYYDRNGHVPEAFNRGLAEQDTEILKEHAVYLSCSSEQMDRINALSEKGGNIHILNPMEIGSAAYSKPSAAYENSMTPFFHPLWVH